jgi:pilin isopeptide linkage protein
MCEKEGGLCTIMNLKKYKKQYKKRAASLGLAFLFLIGLLPSQTFAEESERNASVEFEVELKIDGDLPDKNIPFTFILEEEDDTSKQNDDVTYTVVHGEGIASFSKISYTEPGDYKYIIYQKNGGVENYTYDDNIYYMNVEVRYNRQGNLTATCSASSKRSAGGKETELKFINTYEEPEPVTTEETTTTEKTTTTEEVTTTEKPTLTEEPTTTEKLATTEELVTTEKSATTEESTTVEESTTAEELITTEELTTAEETTTTQELTSTDEPTTTEELTTTEETATTDEPTTTSESAKKPKTGDNTNVLLLIILLCTAVVGMIGCIICRYMGKKHDNE